MMNHGKMLTTSVREGWNTLIHEGGIHIYVVLLYLIIIYYSSRKVHTYLRYIIHTFYQLNVGKYVINTIVFVWQSQTPWYRN
jgi:hypothetical protein